MPLRRPAAGPRVLQRPDEAGAGEYRHLRIVPQAPTIGGLVHGVRLGALDDEQFAELRRALHAWKVLFFEDQDLSTDQLGALADRFGRVIDDTLIARPATNPADSVVVFTRDGQTFGYENEWHSDGTFRSMPTAGTILRAIEVPAMGGDTVFADMAAAFDNLDARDRELVLAGTAVHDWSQGAYGAKYADRLEELRRQLPPVEHPMAIRHPDTGRATLFVNPLFTRHVVGVDPDESDRILAALYAAASLPEIQVRWRWTAGSVAMWDNIACQHYGVNDYAPQRRTMARATFMSREHEQLAAATH